MKKLLFLLSGCFLLFVFLSSSSNATPPPPSPPPTLTYKDIAIQNLNEHPSYHCPDYVAINGWLADLNKKYGDINRLAVETMQSDNLLFWSCLTARMDEYKAESKAGEYEKKNTQINNSNTSTTMCTTVFGILSCTTR